MVMRGLILAVMIPVMAAGCAPSVPWVNPELPKSQAEADYAQCRNAADGQFGERDYAVAADDRSSNPMHMAEQSDNRERFRRYVSACMRALGYFPQK